MNSHNPDQPITLSIIILSYNTLNITKDCLVSIWSSMKGESLSYEIIVVDNASTDGSVAMLERLAKEQNTLKLMLNKENIGFGRANNQAVERAQGEYVFFLNSDIIVLDDAITQLFRYFKQHENEIEFIAGKLLNKDMTPQPSSGPFFTLPVIFGFLFLMGDRWGLTRQSPSRETYTDWMSGACILTKKSYFKAVGGFDEQIFMYMEEVDLLYRAKKLNYRSFIYPKAQFIHLGSASSSKTYPILQVYRGFIYFYRKHYGPVALFLLKNMLQLKAMVAWGIGKILGNQYLIKTYAQAYSLAKKD